MRVVITMAGQSSRFAAAGVDPPKHELIVDGRTMFEYAMASLSAFFDETFAFVVHEEHETRSFVEDRCYELGIDDYDVIEIGAHTDGQATTVLKADSLVQADDAVLVYNIDTHIEPGILQRSALGGDAAIPVVSVLGDHWSFVERDASGTVVRVTEKERISEWASIGLYYFDRWCWFKTAYDSLHASILDEHGEVYIAPLYQWFIDERYDIKAAELPAESVHFLGTPEEVVEFDPSFADRYGL